MAQFAVLIGIGMQVYGQIQAGKQQEKAFRQRADVLELDALAVEKAGREESRGKRLEGKRIAGSQRVRIAGSGIKISATSLLVLAETRREIQKDAGFITEESLRTGSRLRQQAGFERDVGKSARRAGQWGAATSILTGGAAFARAGHESNWWRKKKSSGSLSGRTSGQFGGL